MKFVEEYELRQMVDKIHRSHDGHGRVSCLTRKILSDQYDEKQTDHIMMKLENRGHIDDLSYAEFQNITEYPNYK
jgi:hypothetical protein